jgi:hypothetical protein
MVEMGGGAKGKIGEMGGGGEKGMIKGIREDGGGGDKEEKGNSKDKVIKG